MGFLSFFRLTLFDPDAFDKELTTLTQGISKTRNQVTALTAKRKSTRNNLLFALSVAYIAWVAYRYRVSLSNLGPLSGSKGHISIFLAGQNTHDLINIAVVPLIIAIAVYLVDTLFFLLISSKNKHLKSLLKRHRAKIDDLKRVSNFNTTNELLMKYGKSESRPEATAPSVGNQQKQQAPGPKLNAQSQQPQPNSAIDKPYKKLPPTINRPTKKVVQPQPPSPIVPQGSITKTLQDRLLDYIIGSEHNESVETRYALICANCYTHNGLAPPGCTDPMLVTYICRRCGFINGTMDRTPSPDAAASELAKSKEVVSPQPSESVGGSVSASEAQAGSEVAEDTKSEKDI